MKAPRSVEEFERLAHEYEDAGDYHLADYARAKARSVAFRNRFRIDWRAEWGAFKGLVWTGVGVCVVIAVQVFVGDWVHSDERQKVAHFKVELDMQRNRLNVDEADLRLLMSKLSEAQKQFNAASDVEVSAYNNLVSQYDSSTAVYKEDLAKYNALVDKTNALQRKAQGEPLRVPVRVRW